MRTSSVLLIAGLLGSAGVAPLNADEATVVARASLGDRSVSVTVSDVKIEVLLERRNGSGAPQVFTDAQSLEPVVRTLLQRKLLAAEAARRHVDTEPTVANLVVRSQDLVLSDAISARESQAVDTSESATQAYFASHAAVFRGTPRRRVRHIVVPTEAGAKAARADIAGGATFEEVARARNTDKTKSTGGDLGWMSKGSMVKAFDEVVFASEPGKVSAPVQTTMGWHLVVVEDVDPGSMPPLALVRDRVVDAMRQDAVMKLRQRLLDEAKPTIDRAALEELLK